MNQSTENAIQSGICKLCLQFKPLRNSHMMAKGLYRLCRPPGYDPVGFSEAEIGPTTGRTKAYLLCDDCEQILNKEGEQWVISKLAKYNGKFVLYDLLTKQAPAFQENGITVYATATNPEIDRERLSHFGLGFFGRRLFIRGAGNMPSRSSIWVPVARASASTFLGKGSFRETWRWLRRLSRSP